VLIWLEVAKSIHQERLAEAQRERLLRQLAVVRDSIDPGRRSVPARLRRWLPGQARQPRNTRTRINDGTTAVSPSGATDTHVEGEA
jgi:hypothetical protein